MRSAELISQNEIILTASSGEYFTKEILDSVEVRNIGKVIPVKEIVEVSETSKKVVLSENVSFDKVYTLNIGETEGVSIKLNQYVFYRGRKEIRNS